MNILDYTHLPSDPPPPRIPWVVRAFRPSPEVVVEEHKELKIVEEVRDRERKAEVQEREARAKYQKKYYRANKSRLNKIRVERQKGEQCAR